ncbi:MAG: hypothetical protein ACK5XN_21010 [Bacteroidota bacterium]|jgi:hypothetical protein
MSEENQLIPNLTPTVPTPNATEDVTEKTIEAERKTRKLKVLKQAFDKGWNDLMRVFRVGGNWEKVLVDLSNDPSTAKFVPKYREKLADIRVKLMIAASVPDFHDDSEDFSEDDSDFLPR